MDDWLQYLHDELASKLCFASVYSGCSAFDLYVSSSHSFAYMCPGNSCMCHLSAADIPVQHFDLVNHPLKTSLRLWQLLATMGWRTQTMMPQGACWCVIHVNVHVVHVIDDLTASPVLTDACAGGVRPPETSSGKAACRGKPSSSAPLLDREAVTWELL